MDKGRRKNLKKWTRRDQIAGKILKRSAKLLKKVVSSHFNLNKKTPQMRSLGVKTNVLLIF